LPLINVLSLVHPVIGEQSPARKLLLYVFARYIEVPLLKYAYFLLRGKWRRIGSLKLFRIMASYALVRPFGYLGDTAKPAPYDDILLYIDRIEGPIAVGPCRCRIGHKACGHPLETDIVMRTGYDAWTKAFPADYRTITKNEAKDIVRQCHDLGMMHMIFIHCPVNRLNEYVICNCCTCGCVPYIINRELGQINYPLIDGYYMAVTDSEKCRGCGTCVEICPFEARVLTDAKGKTGRNCYGCGLCTYHCPEQAISMVKLRDPLPPGHGHDHEHVHDHEHGDDAHRPGFYKQHEPYRE
jgi:ferredoxin